MTYNPRIQNIDNIVDISGSLTIDNSNSFLSGNNIIASNLNIQTLYSTGSLTLYGNNQKLNSIRRKSRTISGTVNLSASDSIILADASTGTININLPLAKSAEGRQYTIKKIDNTNNSIILNTETQSSSYSFDRALYSSDNILTPQPGYYLTLGDYDTNFNADKIALYKGPRVFVLFSSSLYSGWHTYWTGSVSNPSDYNLIKMDYSGDTFIVHESYAFLGGIGQSYNGKVEVFKSTNTGYKSDAILSSSGKDGTPLNDSFGYAAAINASGNIIAVGVPRNSLPSGQAGGVYIFRSSSIIGWYEEALLTSSGDGTPLSDSLGASVSINGPGDVVAAGSPDADLNDIKSGIVAIFRSSSNGWRQENIINNAGSNFGDEFGTSVSLDYAGRRVAIGAPFNDSLGGVNNSGLVYVYQSGTSGWTNYLSQFGIQGLNASSSRGNPSTSLYFGNTNTVHLDSSGENLFVSLPTDDYIYNNSGLIVHWDLRSSANIQGATFGDASPKEIPIRYINGLSSISQSFSGIPSKNGQKIVTFLTRYNYLTSTFPGALIIHEKRRILKNPVNNNTSSFDIDWQISDILPFNSWKLNIPVVSDFASAQDQIKFSNNSNNLYVGAVNFAVVTNSNNVADRYGSKAYIDAGGIFVYNSTSAGYILEQIVTSSTTFMVDVYDSRYNNRLYLGESFDVSDNKKIAASRTVYLPDRTQRGIVIFGSSSALGWREERVLTASSNTNLGAISINQPGNKVISTDDSTGSVLIWTLVGNVWREERVLTSSNSENYQRAHIRSGSRGNLIAAYSSTGSTGDTINIFGSSSLNGWRLEQKINLINTNTTPGTDQQTDLQFNNYNNEYYFKLNASGTTIAAIINSYVTNLQNTGVNDFSIQIFKSSSTGWRNDAIIKDFSSLQFITPSVSYNGVASMDINVPGNKIVTRRDNYNIAVNSNVPSYINKDNVGTYIKPEIITYHSLSNGWVKYNNLINLPHNLTGNSINYSVGRIAIDTSGGLIAWFERYADNITGSTKITSDASVYIFTSNSSGYDLIDDKLSDSITTKNESITLVSDGESKWYKI